MKDKIKSPHVVALGGGTGLSTLLRGLKKFTRNITAIVTVADDGGGSGVLRQDLGMLPPGDIRNCILALADTEPVMYKLLNYRFNEGMLKGQSFGNLFLAAMNGISSSFEEAVKKMSDVLAVVGRVLPVTVDDVNLKAYIDDGQVILGESSISNYIKGTHKRVVDISLEPETAKPLPEVIESIDRADIIVMGPGSLYTSLLPNLLVDDVSEHINRSGAKKIFVLNIMTQIGETQNYNAYDHIDEFLRIGMIDDIDYILANNSAIPEGLLNLYIKDNAEPVYINDMDYRGAKIINKDLLGITANYIRHDGDKLAKAIMDLYNIN